MELMTIFFVWLGSTVPAPYQATYQQCLANYGPCVLVGEEMENKLLEKYNIHHSNNTVIMRADLIRLLAIQEYGGIYLDFDSQVPNWSFFKGLRCEDTFFGPDQWRVLQRSQVSPSNSMICSGRNTTTLKRLIEGIRPTSGHHPTTQQIFNYAGPEYAVKNNVSVLVFYPNVNHCYDNTWIGEKAGRCYKAIFLYDIRDFVVDHLKTIIVMIVVLLGAHQFRRYRQLKEALEEQKQKKGADEEKQPLRLLDS